MYAMYLVTQIPNLDWTFKGKVYWEHLITGQEIEKRLK